MRYVLIALAACFAIVLSGRDGNAGQAPSFCGVTGISPPGSITFDPFSGNAANQVNVNLTLTRFTAGGGAKTQLVDFYLVKPVGAPAYTITYNGANVVYTAPGPNILTLPSPPPSGTIYYNFGGSAQPDTTTIPLVVTIPANTPLTSGAPITFDIVYICTGTGGMSDVSTPQTLTQAITIQVTVPEALQISYAGPALEFGEIGTVTNAQAPSHSVTGQFNIRSTSAYSVTVAPSKGYLMSHLASPGSPGTDTVKYSIDFLGKTVQYGSTAFGTVNCPTAGTANVVNLPITAKLVEGGQGKTPSPVYSDTLTVTISPLIVGTPATPGAVCS